VCASCAPGTYSSTTGATEYLISICHDKALHAWVYERMCSTLYARISKEHISPGIRLIKSDFSFDYFVLVFVDAGSFGGEDTSYRYMIWKMSQ